LTTPTATFSVSLLYSAEAIASTVVDIPFDSDGLAENPDAYRLWQPKKMEGEVISAEEWQERWTRLRERLLAKN
jgi:hypothetical protein